MGTKEVCIILIFSGNFERSQVKT